MELSLDGKSEKSIGVTFDIFYFSNECQMLQSSVCISSNVWFDLLKSIYHYKVVSKSAPLFNRESRVHIFLQLHKLYSGQCPEVEESILL